jgi:ribosomal protein S15P/S13E
MANHIEATVLDFASRKSLSLTGHRRGRLLNTGTIEQAKDSAAQAWVADTVEAKHSSDMRRSNRRAKHFVVAT